MNDWAMPRDLWRTIQDGKTGGKASERQTQLDACFEKVSGPREFTREGVLDAIAKHIVCDDQALALADNATFKNCLVAMRPRATSADLPSTHDVTVYINNEFIAVLTQLKARITVRHFLDLLLFADSANRLALARFPAPWMAGQQTIRRHHL